MSVLRNALLSTLLLGFGVGVTACGVEGEAGPIESFTSVDAQGRTWSVDVYEAGDLESSAQGLEAAGGPRVPGAKGDPSLLCPAICAELCGGRDQVKWCTAGDRGCTAGCKDGGGLLDLEPTVLSEG